MPKMILYKLRAPSEKLPLKLRIKIPIWYWKKKTQSKLQYWNMKKDVPYSLYEEEHKRRQDSYRALITALEKMFDERKLSAVYPDFRVYKHDEFYADIFTLENKGYSQFRDFIFPGNHLNFMAPVMLPVITTDVIDLEAMPEDERNQKDEDLRLETIHLLERLLSSDDRFLDFIPKDIPNFPLNAKYYAKMTNPGDHAIDGMYVKPLKKCIIRFRFLPSREFVSKTTKLKRIIK